MIKMKIIFNEMPKIKLHDEKSLNVTFTHVRHVSP